ncbi:Glycogen recognition site of AMP-activated protein kinase [Parelusimicrobium proximum]|uniref:glycogen-binding domain-containing protein n=1 Tax=Parelusimicrobium proximum TaxID=3228953 RepID=UPI003D17948B
MTDTEMESQDREDRKSRISLTGLSLASIGLAVCIVLLFIQAESFDKFINNWLDRKKSVSTKYVPPHINKRPAAKVEHETKYRKFFITAPRAKRVEIIADFNGWGKVPIVLTPYSKGYFETSIVLTSGNYKYVFMVDGAEVLDPSNNDIIIYEGRKVNIKTVR